MKKLTILILSIMVILAAFLLVRHTGWRVAAGDSIHVAVLGPMSGDNASVGKSFIQGINLYLDEINQEGKLAGKRVVLDIYDDQNKRSLAKEKALEVIKDNRAVAVIGHHYSSCSISAGQVYRDNCILAISPVSTNVDVTHDNDYYCRVVFNDNLQGRFLANYSNKVLKQDTISIISEDLAYGDYLAEIFEETSKELGVEIKHKWDFKTTDPHIDAALGRIVDELESKDGAGLVFLATHAPEGIKLVKLIKDKGLDNPIILPDSFASKTFPMGFKDFPKERLNPGYYTNGLHVINPLIFDSADENAQHFRETYKEKYQEEPGWRAAYAHDAMMVLMEAIEHTGVEGKPGTLKADRREIRDYLASIDDIDSAIEGVTGFNYFDANGDSPKPISIGIFKNTKIISAPTQLQAIRNLNEIYDLDAALKDERVLLIDNKYMYRTNVVYTGIKLNEIGELDVDNQVFTLDFHVWFRYQGDLPIEKIAFLNAVETVQLEELIEKKTMDGTQYRLYHVKDRFKADFFHGQPVFGEHILEVGFRHRDLTRSNLIFVQDVLGMGLMGKQSLLERKEKIQVLSPVTGWAIDQIWFSEDISSKRSMGNPEQLQAQGGTVDHSRFNANILIKKNAFTLRGSIRTKLVNYLLVSGVLILLALYFAGKSRILMQFPKTIWMLQLIIAAIILLSGEVVLVDWLTGTLGPYSLKLMIQTFDILWWVIPAIFLTTAIERFIWAPLEKRTNQTIPDIIRRFLSFIVYLLAFFGIIAFVYDQKLTSLLATSGVLAMIIGLAVQINISNIFSGIALNLERPFRIGDWVKIGSFETGKVVDISWRSVKLETVAECILSIPNSTVSESDITNYHYPDDRYWEWFPVHIDPIYQPDRVQKIILDALLSSEYVLKDPPPLVRLEFTDWSVAYYPMFSLIDYGKRPDQKNEITKNIWTHLNRAGITPAEKREKLRLLEGKEDREKIATDPLEILGEAKVFQYLPDQAKSGLDEKMISHHYPPGEIVFRQDDGGDSLFVISEGVVGVFIKVEKEEWIEMLRLGAGDFFGGEMALMNGKNRLFSVRTIADTYVFEIAKDDFFTLMVEHSECHDYLRHQLTYREKTVETRKQIHKMAMDEKETGTGHSFFPRLKQFLFVRKQPRIAVEEDMDISVYFRRQGEEPFKARMDDISLGGISYRCPRLEHAFRKGDRVYLEIRAPGVLNKPISITGVVSFHGIQPPAPHEPPDRFQEIYGIQFLAPTQAQNEKIGHLVSLIQEKI